MILEISKNDLIEFDYSKITKEVLEIRLDNKGEVFTIKNRGSWLMEVCYYERCYSKLMESYNIELVIEKLKEIVFCK
jgi:hypothetical protein